MFSHFILVHHPLTSIHPMRSGSGTEEDYDYTFECRMVNGSTGDVCEIRITTQNPIQSDLCMLIFII